jgi:hypothetical protein
VVRERGTNPAEHDGFPVDHQLPDPDDVLYRAVNVDARPELTWRWVCQLRAAPYSYDWIDNFGRRSPRHLVPGLDELEVGQRAMSIFRVTAFEAPRFVTFFLDQHPCFGRVVVTYVVDPASDGRSRLRARVLVRYPRALPVSVVAPVLLPPGDLVMMRKQLRTIKALAEQDARG